MRSSMRARLVSSSLIASRAALTRSSCRTIGRRHDLARRIALDLLGEPRDTLRGRHRVELDPVALEPVGPAMKPRSSATAATAHRARRRRARRRGADRSLDRLDLQAHLDAFPGLQAEVDDLDLAGAARLRLVLTSVW